MMMNSDDFLRRCPPARQAVFRKAMVLHELGQVDKALQVFLQCLALDEDFHSAKRQVEAVSLPALHWWHLASTDWRRHMALSPGVEARYDFKISLFGELL